MKVEMKDRINKVVARSNRSSTLTFGLASFYINGIIPGSIVRNPLDAGRKLLDEVRIESANSRSGDVASVYANRALIRTPGRKALQKFRTVLRIVFLSDMPGSVHRPCIIYSSTSLTITSAISLNN